MHGDWVVREDVRRRRAMQAKYHLVCPQACWMVRTTVSKKVGLVMHHPWPKINRNRRICIWTKFEIPKFQLN